MTDFPRPLSGRERQVLDHLLSAEFPGVEALRMQAVSELGPPRPYSRDYVEEI